MKSINAISAPCYEYVGEHQVEIIITKRELENPQYLP